MFCGPLEGDAKYTINHNTKLYRIMPNKWSKQWEEEVIIEAAMTYGRLPGGTKGLSHAAREGRGLRHRQEHSLCRELGWERGLEQGKLQAESPIHCEVGLLLRFIQFLDSTI